MNADDATAKPKLTTDDLEMLDLIRQGVVAHSWGLFSVRGNSRAQHGHAVQRLRALGLARVTHAYINRGGRRHTRVVELTAAGHKALDAWQDAAP